jgi:V/A-type H+-transporting ATPase subunit C
MRSPLSIYLITRVHGLMTHLLTSDEIQLLVKAGTLEQFADRLVSAGYSKEISRPGSEKILASDLEVGFLKKMSSRFFFVSSISPKKFKDFVLAYAKKFEVEDMKRVIRAKHAGERVENLIPLSDKQTSIDFKALIEAKDLSEVIKILSRTEYAPLANSTAIFNEYKTTIVYEADLDNIYYSGVWRAAKKLHDKEIMHLISQEIDTRNLLRIFIMKSRKLRPKLIEHFVILGGTLEKARLTSMTQSEVGEMPSRLKRTPYVQAANEAVAVVDKKLGMYKMEAALCAPFYRGARSLKPLRLSYVFSYLVQSEIEAKNLVAIAMAKQLKLPSSVLSDIIML